MTSDLLDQLRAAWQARTAFASDDRGIMSEVRMVGGGLVLMIIVVLTVTEVHGAINWETNSSANNSSYVGPFADVLNATESTGVAALTLLVVGFLVVAAAAIMRYFGGGFGGGR